VIRYWTFPKRPGPHRQSRLALNAWRLCFWGKSSVPAVCHVWLKVNYLIAVVIATASHGKFELATGPVPSRRVRCTNGWVAAGRRRGDADAYAIQTICQAPARKAEGGGTSHARQGWSGKPVSSALMENRLAFRVAAGMKKRWPSVLPFSI
jgi:hypothetical protein